jgi:hypothetical protein
MFKPAWEILKSFLEWDRGFHKIKMSIMMVIDPTISGSLIKLNKNNAKTLSRKESLCVPAPLRLFLTR